MMGTNNPASVPTTPISWPIRAGWASPAAAAPSPSTMAPQIFGRCRRVISPTQSCGVGDSEWAVRNMISVRPAAVGPAETAGTVRDGGISPEERPHEPVQAHEHGVASVEAGTDRQQRACHRPGSHEYEREERLARNGHVTEGAGQSRAVAQEVEGEAVAEHPGAEDVPHRGAVAPHR